MNLLCESNIVSCCIHMLGVNYSPENVVNKEQHVLAFLVPEVLGFRDVSIGISNEGRIGIYIPTVRPVRATRARAPGGSFI